MMQIVPQFDEEQELPQDAQDSYSNSPSPTPLRRSERERRPGRMLTYSSLGHPTYEPHPSVNAVDTYLMPYTHLLYSPPYLSSAQYAPLLPQFSYNYTVHDTYPIQDYWKGPAHTVSS